MKTLLILMKALLLSGLLTTALACSSKEVIYQEIRPLCPAPVKPVLIPLDENSHIGSRDNVGILITNIADLSAYTDMLRATIRCYGSKE